MHYNCLIVDDEKELANMTAEYFEMFEVSTKYVCSAAECYSFLDENDVDLILLDINLGDGSGFEVCKKVREKYMLPILFISARQSDDDILVALSIGGDDYIKKPYSLSVLLAKVKVNLKRVEQLKKISNSESGVDGNNNDASENSASNNDESRTTSKDSVEKMLLDESTMSVILNGERISLRAKEFALLKCLYEHRNTIVTKDVLFDEVWGDAFYSDGTLNVHIRKLREKLEADPNSPEYIKTVWGTGYILEA